MVFFPVIAGSTSLRASCISYDCFSAINLVEDVAHTFQHFLRLDAGQEYGRNDFGSSIRPPHLHRAFFSLGDARFCIIRSTYEAIHWVASRQDEKEPSTSDAETKNPMGGPRPAKSS